MTTPFLYAPCVFLVGEHYQIGFNTSDNGIAWVEVGEERYVDHVLGVVRSETTIHKVTVPRAALDAAQAYTICFQPMLERKPYYPVTGEVARRTMAFRPMDFSKEARIYMVSDTHSRTEEPIRAAQFFGETPCLYVLNGDIADKSSSVDNILTLYRLNDALTGGERPVVFVRGNHDTRGICATELHWYTGTPEGRTYFHFRLGKLWAVVLDCGEDKLDEREEYNGTACFAPYRREQTAYLEALLASREWADPSIEHRVAICHIPFPYWPEDTKPHFRIEQDVYARWTQLLGEMGVQVLLGGHWHRQFVVEPGEAGDNFGMGFPVIVGSNFLRDGDGAVCGFAGTALTLSGGKGEALFTDDAGRVLSSFTF